MIVPLYFAHFGGDARARETERRSMPKSTEKKRPEPRPEPTPSVVMPKFNPFERPAATQAADPTPVQQSYEDVQREAKGPGVEEWRKVDKLRSELGALYDSLREDERYAPEYKSEAAWKRYEEARTKVEELAPLARERMLKSAQGLERMSVPTPSGDGLIPRYPEDVMLYERLLLLALAEASLARQASTTVKAS